MLAIGAKYMTWKLTRRDSAIDLAILHTTQSKLELSQQVMAHMLLYTREPGQYGANVFPG